MDKLSPVTQLTPQFATANPMTKPVNEDIGGVMSEDRVELTLTGAHSREKALLIYEKTVVDALKADMGIGSASEDPRLVAYRSQADDGFDNLTPENWTPEKVAGRILKFTLGLFDLFKTYGENGGLSDEEVLKKFKALVESSVTKGYEQALGSIGDVPEEVSSQLRQTMDLVQKGIDEWYNERLSQLSPPAEENKAE